jgi:pimeloyl-ACP methyl ester carboxylesterase
MSRIVVVHGVFNELWGPHEVHQRWLPAVRDGLWHHGVTIDDADVGVGFYGDLFRHAADERPDDKELRRVADESGLLDVVQQAGGRDTLESLAKLIGLATLRRVVDQAGRYFAQPEVRAAVRARVERAITPETRVVVAHSLGSIVAYEVLAMHPEWSIAAFVTIGSPLSNIRFMHLIEPAVVEGHSVWPACVQSWTNVAAVDDAPCGEGRLAPFFGDRVQDIRVDNGHRAHDPEPYLNAAATGAAIAAGLGKRPS